MQIEQGGEQRHCLLDIVDRGVVRSISPHSNLSSLYFIAAAAHVLAGYEKAARRFAADGLKRESSFRLRFFAEAMAPSLADRIVNAGQAIGLPF